MVNQTQLVAARMAGPGQDWPAEFHTDGLVRNFPAFGKAFGRK
ncbi:MAG: hypothetical protein ACP5M4_07385 [Acidobacteriaceae bacterium]